MQSAPKNNSHAGTKWQGTVFETYEGRARDAISPCALYRHVLYRRLKPRFWAGTVRGDAEGAAMRLLNLTRMDRPACVFAAVIALTAAWPAAAQTSIKFSLDGRLEGLAATFFLPQDRGYFKAEGLDVTVDEATTALEPITRVASGAYDMALADINTLIKYRDQHPSPPVRAVFMVYNKPPFAIVARRSRGITDPKQLEGK